MTTRRLRLPRSLLAGLALIPALALSCHPASSDPPPGQPDAPAAPAPPPAPEPTPAPPPPPPPVAPARLELVDMMAWPGLEGYDHALGADLGINITTYAFDSDMDGYLDDPRIFRREFTKLVPPDFDGIVSLDWEHTITKWLKQPPESTEFRRAVRNLKELLILAKQVRPRARIGYFGLPLHEYWKRDEQWLARCRGMVEFLRFADWVGPCTYNFYKTGDQQPAERQRAFVVANVEMALEVAQAAGGKPVYAWVHHRYHPSNDRYAFKEVVESDYRDTIRAILSVKYRGRGVDGIILWGADRYYHRTGALKITGDANAVMSRVTRQYLRWTAEEMGKVEREEEGQRD